MLERLRVDLASAIHNLRATPVTVIAAIFTLAVAVGMNLAMFGLIDRALLSPPAYVANPDRVFTLGFEHTNFDGQRSVMTTTSYVAYESIREQTTAASETAAWRRASVSAMVDGNQIQAEALLVSGSYFSMLETRAGRGRGILADDDRAPAGSPVAVLSHAFWKGQFAGDERVLGRRFTIHGVDFQVVGVMPAGFSGHSAIVTDVWLPLHAVMSDTPGWDRDQFRNVVEIGLRIRPDRTLAVAAAQAEAAVRSRVMLTPLSGAPVAPTEHMIAYWLGTVSIMVFAIGLANAATLLLVRGSKRRRELSLRMALGATRGRLVSTMCAEACILATASVGVALVLAQWLDNAVRQVLFPAVIESPGTSVHTAGAAMLAGICTIVVACAAGVAQLPAAANPAFLATATRRRPGYAPLLLVQTTLAVVLIAGAGLFGRSLHKLAAQDFGMRMDGVVVARFGPGAGLIEGEDRLFASALDRIRALPGVALATPVETVPFAGHQVPPISVPGLNGMPTIDGQPPFLIAATPELFDILGLSIVQGRRFTEADDRGAPVAIVNDTMARAIWPARSALGQCFRIGFDPSFDPMTAVGPPAPAPTAPCREVIGIVRDVRQRSVVPSGNEARLMQFYVPFSQSDVHPPNASSGPHIQGLMLRTNASTDALAPAIRHLVIGDRTDLPFLEVRPYVELLNRQMRPWRTGTALLTLFSALALVVAGMGLYAAFAHAVGERRREMAIRIAIGAHPRDVRLMVLREATFLAAVGISGGWAAAAISGPWVESLLFETTASDVVVLGLTGTIMFAVALAATLVPAYSASRADPSALLRAE